MKLLFDVKDRGKRVREIFMELLFHVTMLSHLSIQIKLDFDIINIGIEEWNIKTKSYEYNEKKMPPKKKKKTKQEGNTYGISSYTTCFIKQCFITNVLHVEHNEKYL